MTIKEIAKKANVSLGTVDRVIHNRGRVSESTREKILQILEEVDYKPNLFARALVLNKSYKIAALVPKFEQGDYWEIPSQGIQKAADNLEQFGLKVTFFYFDQNEISSFVDKANAVIEFNPDGIILAPVINFEAVKLCDRLKKQQIPFILIDSNIPNSGAISFIGQNAEQSGKLAAKLLSNLMNFKGKFLIVRIKNNENHNNTLQKRTEGFKNFLLKSDYLANFELEELSVNQRDPHWQVHLEDVLSKSNPKGIYVPSSKVHFVADILKKNDWDIHLLGNDLIERNIPHISSGVIDFVIGDRPESQGHMALDNFYKLLVTKQPFPENYYLPLDIITRENLVYYTS